MKQRENQDTLSISDAPVRELLQLVSGSFKRHRVRIVVGFVALLLVDFSQLIIPRVVKEGVDGLSTLEITSSQLVNLSGLIILLALAVAVMRFCWRYLIIGFSRLLERDLRDRMFSHILKMDAQFFDKHTTGDLMARMSNDLSAVQMACGMGMVAAIDAIVMSAAAIGFMMYIDVKLTLLALLPMPFLAILTKILSARLHKRFTTVQEQFSQLTEFARSTLVSVRLIKAYTSESFQSNRFNDLGMKYVNSNLKVAFIQGLMFPIATLVGSLGMLLVLLYGGRLAIRGVITMGDFVAFISYLYMLVWPMMAIGWVANLVQRGLTSLNRINKLMSSRSELPAISAPGLSPVTAPTLTLKGLSFHYAGENNNALEDIDLEFGPGIHGVTGRTGSGKSTLCRLLARLYPTEDGQFFLQGQDVNTLPVEYVRNHIGYVSQEPVLFSESIGANIQLGKPDATPEEVEAAARDAAIHGDILEFPNGYDTLIGERGVRLSGGQRQRLALARALLCERPVLIIDDGLSAVDVATEHEAFQGLRKRLTGKTVVIVSNRIKLLSMTERIVVFEEGRLIHDAGHEQLLLESSLYQSMYRKQMRKQPAEVVTA